jgi:DNA-binding response OmpR family regulator
MVFNDSREILGLLGHILKHEGYRVTLESFEAKHLQQISVIMPDLVILDCDVTQDGDCWEIAQQLRTNPETASLPLILCIFSKQNMHDAKAYLSGKQIFLLDKPYNINDLLLTINRVFKEANDTPAPDADI